MRGMGHWANSHEHKAAVARRDAAVALATARGYKIGLHLGMAQREPDGIDDILTKVHERRGIRALLAVGTREQWPETARWRFWWKVDVNYTDFATLFLSRPRAIIVHEPTPEAVARAKRFGIVVWDPFFVPGSGTLKYASPGAKEPASRPRWL
jgi:hypothetical protein